ncbi:MAG: cyclic nucleotide-binding domain-containing protein [Candidatus Ozemobacteraceae bacterium]
MVNALEAFSPDVNIKVKLMRSIPFFEGFSSDEMAYTAQLSEWLKFELGDVILREGDPGSTFWIILKGSVRVVKRTEDKNDHVLATIPTGECFGEMSFVSGQPRTAHIISNEEVFVFKIDGQKLERAAVTLQLKFFKRFTLLLTNRLARTSSAIFKTS